MVKFYTRNEDDENFDADVKEIFTNEESTIDTKLTGLYLQNQQILSLLRELSVNKQKSEIRSKILR